MAILSFKFRHWPMVACNNQWRNDECLMTYMKNKVEASISASKHVALGLESFVDLKELRPLEA